jgi:hypothetical protein
MAKLVYRIWYSWIGDIAEKLTDRVNVAFCLTINLVVVRGGHLKLDLKVLYRLLPEV